MAVETWKEKMEREERMVKRFIAGGVGATVALVCLVVFFAFNSAGCQRWKTVWATEHSFDSGTYGQERKITLYDFNGNKVEEWSGRCDMQHRKDGVYDIMFYDDQGNVIKRELIDPGHGQLTIEQVVE